MADFTAKIQALLDVTQLESSLNSLSTKTIDLKNVKISNFTLDTTRFVSEIQSALNKNKFTISIDKVNMSNVLNQVKSSGSSAGNTFANSFNKGLASINVSTSNAKSEIQKLQKTLASMNFDQSSIDVVTNSLDEMNLAISKVTTRLDGNGLNVTVKGVDELKNTVTIVKQFDAESGKILTVGKTISQSFDDGTAAAKKFASQLSAAQNAIKNNSIDSAVSKVVTQFQKLSTTTIDTTSMHTSFQEIETDIQQLQTLQEQLKTSSSNEELVANWNEYNEILTRVKNNMTTVANEGTKMASQLEVVTLKGKMESWLAKNTNASNTFRSSVQSLITQLDSMNASGGVSKTQLDSLATSFKEIDVACTSAGQTTKSFGSILQSAFSSISKYFSVAQIIYTSINAIKEGINTVVELDDALVDLQKTTEASYSELQDFYYEANEIAKEYGSTTQEIIQSAADWSRLGYSLDDSTLMAQYSSMFASISPGMDIDTATTGLVSTMKAKCMPLHIEICA